MTTAACAICDETGFQVQMCTVGARCGRPQCLTAPAEHEHRYARRCVCRQRLEQDEPNVPFDARMAAAGRDE